MSLIFKAGFVCLGSLDMLRPLFFVEEADSMYHRLLSNIADGKILLPFLQAYDN